jgi:beta-glucosidase
MERDFKSLIALMTLEEKAGLCSGLNFWMTKGIERLGIPSKMVTDGPHGLRKQAGSSDHLGLNESVPATCFPTAAGLASTWNREMITKVGAAIGRECQAEDVAILLGPGANIKRSPLCGRNFEYFSEDPFLSSEMAASHIIGVQSEGVGTSLKHFAVNNQEHRRMSSNSVVDERTLREIYLASFEMAVKKAQPWTIMCSYNKVNGTYASENPYLLTDILRDEWGFEGYVMSDWGAVNQRVDALKAGLELEMPASYGTGERKIVEAVQNGELSEELLDRAVERILRILFKYVDNKKPNATFNADEHHRLAMEVACESMVLLKNADDILPLAKKGKIAAIGALARNPRYQGSGSSRIRPTRLGDIYEELVKAAGAASVVYTDGYHLDHDDINPTLVEEAKAVAREVDVAVLFVGLPDRYESEGYDRSHLRIPANQIALIEAVSEVQPNVIVVLSNGAPIVMPWLPKVKAVLEGYLGGQALGEAIAALLFGDANPSGKLAETFPVQLSDNPSYLFFPGDLDTVEYREGIYVGYRYYDKAEVEPLFPFGHGLSYTQFDYSDFVLSDEHILDTEAVKVSVTVRNTGSCYGKDVVQLYVSDVDSRVSRPLKELKGFEKVALQPGESKIVTFVLDKRSFAYYDVDLEDWCVESGEFNLLIGRSSRAIELQGTILVESTTRRKMNVDRNTLVGDLMADVTIGSHVMPIIDEMLAKHPLKQVMGEEGAGEMIEAMLRDMPLRALSNFSGGTLPEEALLEMIRRLNETN